MGVTDTMSVVVRVSVMDAVVVTKTTGAEAVTTTVTVVGEPVPAPGGLAVLVLGIVDCRLTPKVVPLLLVPPMPGKSWPYPTRSMVSGPSVGGYQGHI